MSAVLKLATVNGKTIAEQPRKHMQDGFVAIPNDVDDALLRSPLTKQQERVYRAILRKTIGYGKADDCISNGQISSMTGLDESDIRKVINALLDMGMIQRGRRTQSGTFTAPVLDTSAWDYKRGDSPRIAPQTGRFTPNRWGDSPPHNRQYQKTTTPPMSPNPRRERKKAVPLTTWLAEIKANGEQAIPEDDPLFVDADKTGLPLDYLRICWLEFRDLYRDGDRQSKRYADWRAAFRNAVRSNWFKLWAMSAEGEYFLTTQGKMAMRRFEEGKE